MTKTVASAHARIDALQKDQESHEELCAERYKRIDEKQDDLKLGLKWIIGLMVTILLSVSGFGLVAVYDDLKEPEAHG